MLSALLTCPPPKKTIASCFTAELRAIKKPYNTAKRYCDQNRSQYLAHTKLPYGALTDVEALFKLGVVSATLTWNYDNALAGGALDNGELSELGKDIIKAFNRYNIALDLAHLNEKSFFKAAELADKVLVSHTGLKTLVNHKRNVTDEQVLYLKNRGGIIGLSVYPEFIGKDVKSGFLDAVEHLISLGCEDIIAFGSDFDGAKMSNEINNISNCVQFNKFLEEKTGKLLAEKVFYCNSKTFF